jgi:hypothetical protein
MGKHTHIHTYMFAYSFIHVCVYIYIYRHYLCSHGPHIQTYTIHTHTCGRQHLNSANTSYTTPHTHTHIYNHVCKYIHTCRRQHLNKCKNTTIICPHTHTHTHKITNTSTQIYIHTFRPQIFNCAGTSPTYRYPHTHAPVLTCMPQFCKFAVTRHIHTYTYLHNTQTHILNTYTPAGQNFSTVQTLVPAADMPNHLPVAYQASIVSNLEICTHTLYMYVCMYTYMYVTIGDSLSFFLSYSHTSHIYMHACMFCVLFIHRLSLYDKCMRACTYNYRGYKLWPSPLMLRLVCCLVKL